MTPDQLEKLHDQQQSQAAHAAASQKLPRMRIFQILPTSPGRPWEL